MRNPTRSPSAACWPWLVAIAAIACRDGSETDAVVGPSFSGEPPAPGPTPPPGYSTEQIAYTWTKDNADGEIYVMSATGKHPTRVTFAAGVESELTWTPDGSRLAFVRTVGGTSQIHVMNADGSGDVNLSNGAASDIHPVWSPDGQRILFQRLITTAGRLAITNWEVFVMNADGSGKANLSQYSLAYDGDARWSPDGSQIVFVSSRDGNPEVYRMNGDGGNKLNLTQNPRPDGAPDWSPDGSRIAFMRKFSGAVFPVFHLMNPDGTGQVAYPLSYDDDPAGINQVRWSPSGAKLLLSTSSCCGDVWTINADGTGPVILAYMDYLRASWSSDGTLVVMSSGDVCGGWDLVTHGAEGGGYAVLTPCNDYDSADWAAWRP